MMLSECSPWVAALLLVGCWSGPTREGYYECSDASECPMGWVCRAGSDGDERCFMDSGDPGDSGSGCDDADEDGHADVACGGDDCDDDDPDRHPGNAEACDDFDRDEDCDPTTLASPADGDADGDGFVSSECCNLLVGGRRCGSDCDDEDPGINRSAVDGCGGGDQDCDGEIDEDPDITFYRDRDGDGYGDDDDAVVACTAPVGYVVRGGDCDDTASDVNPGASEGCEGSIDAGAGADAGT